MSLQNKTSVGQRDKRITIVSPHVTDGSANSDIVDSWDEVAEVWARVEQKHGYLQMEADRLTTTEKRNATIFNIRYRAGLNLRMRVWFEGFAYEIMSFVGNNRKGEIEIAGQLLDNEIVS